MSRRRMVGSPEAVARRISSPRMATQKRYKRRRRSGRRVRAARAYRVLLEPASPSSGTPRTSQAPSSTRPRVGCPGRGVFAITEQRWHKASCGSDSPLDRPTLRLPPAAPAPLRPRARRPTAFDPRPPGAREHWVSGEHCLVSGEHFSNPRLLSIAVTSLVDVAG